MRFWRGFVCLLIGYPPTSVSAQSPEPVGFDTIAVVDPNFGLPTGFALLSDGSLIVADSRLTAVLRIGIDGSIIWRVGNEGRGPGEFVMPYRVGAGPDDEIHVVDMAAQDVTRLSPDGAFIGRYRWPFNFRNIDSIVPLHGGRVAVSGVVTTEPSIAHAAVHMFDAQHEHVRSFGPLPPADDERKLAIWGAGALTRAENALLYTRRLPYEIYRFSLSGEELERIVVPVYFRFEVDDYLDISENGTRVQYTTRRDVREAPINAFQLCEGRILANRVSDDGRYGDFVAADRRSFTPVRYDDNWSAIVAFDVRRSLVWVLSTVEDEFILLLIRLTGVGTCTP